MWFLGFSVFLGFFVNSWLILNFKFQLKKSVKTRIFYQNFQFFQINSEIYSKLWIKSKNNNNVNFWGVFLRIFWVLFFFDNPVLPCVLSANRQTVLPTISCLHATTYLKKTSSSSVELDFLPPSTKKMQPITTTKMPRSAQTISLSKMSPRSVAALLPVPVRTWTSSMVTSHYALHWTLELQWTWYTSTSFDNWICRSLPVPKSRPKLTAVQKSRSWGKLDSR